MQPSRVHLSDAKQRLNQPATRRGGWLKGIVVISLVAAGGLALLAPRLLSSPRLANAIIERYGGLGPLKLRIGNLSLGWLAPVELGDVRLVDQSDQLLLHVHSISTAKGLWGWISDYTDLGSIEIDGVEATVVMSAGTSNVEDALSVLLPDAESDLVEPAPVAPAFRPRGSIHLTNARVVLMDATSPGRWLIEVPSVKTQLPTADQLIGPTDLMAIVGEVSGAVSGSLGEIQVKAEQSSDGAIELQATLNNLALDIWQVLQSRLPELPIEQLTGRASGRVSGQIHDADNWSFDLRDVEVQRWSMMSAELLGDAPARLESVFAGGRVTLAGNVLQVEESQLTCDVGQLEASAVIPWPLVLPTLSSPFLDGATLIAAGQIDLPKLVAAAQTLIPVRADTQLVAGQLRFRASQKPAPREGLEAGFSCTLTGLAAHSDGQSLTWDDPLTVDVSASQRPVGLEFSVAATSEFCRISGQGTMENGRLGADIDLDLLHQRLSQFVDLPISTMTGSADVKLQWQLDNQEQVAAQGSLKTTPLVIATATGGEMREPSWEGSFQANVLLRDGAPRLLNHAQLDLIAPNEQLSIALQEPMLLVEDQEVLPPAAFHLALVGDLSGWKRRGLVWLGEPPDVDVQGAIQLAVSGRIDLEHAEILQANWDTEPLRLRVADFALAEPKMVGNFKGRIDTNDLTRLQVNQLTVQANSFWIVAQDEAVADNGRSGKANFLMDLQRLMHNLNGAPTGAVLPADMATTYSATGKVQGQLEWQVGSSGAEFALQARGENLVLVGTGQSPAATSPWWSEPDIQLALSGQWTSADGAIDLSAMQLRAPWLNYQGQLAYRSTDQSQDLTLGGEAAYDAGQLSAKLAPLTGNHLQMAGQQNAPIQVHWHRDSQASPDTAALAGLQASTRIGWQQARIIGIELGRADVPITIDAGHLTSAAEIPVSGGMLRWDIFSDLTRDLLVIEQKPMMVLENVAITKEMCSSWLKYVAPLVAEATSIDGRLSLSIGRAELTPTDLTRQTVEGKLVMHRAEVGPGPLANEIGGLIRQLEIIRKPDLAQSVSTPNRVWLELPQQQISFRMVDGKVYHRDLNVSVGDASITTSGAVDVSGQLEMLASLPIPDSWTQRGPILATLRGQTLQFPIGGTVYRPQLDASALAQLGRQTLQNAAQGLLQQGINRGLDRLFRPQ